MKILYKHKLEDTYGYIKSFYYRNDLTNISCNVKYFQVNNNYVEHKEHHYFDLIVGIKLLKTYR